MFKKLQMSRIKLQMKSVSFCVRDRRSLICQTNKRVELSRLPHMLIHHGGESRYSLTEGTKTKNLRMDGGKTEAEGLVSLRKSCTVRHNMMSAKSNNLSPKFGLLSLFKLSKHWRHQITKRLFIHCKNWTMKPKQTKRCRTKRQPANYAFCETFKTTVHRKHCHASSVISMMPPRGLSSNDCVNSRAPLHETWHKSSWAALWYPGIWSAVILWIIPRAIHHFHQIAHKNGSHISQWALECDSLQVYFCVCVCFV